MSMSATYSPDDNKIRIYSIRRLDAETYARVKAAGFKWAPKQDLFFAPMWTPAREDLAIELCGEIEDEDTSLVDRAEIRADRFDGYSDKRAADAERAREAVAAIADGIPFGQPILVGHHSERRARKDAQRIDSGMRKAIKMWDTSQYWSARAAGALHHAKYKERPDVRARRIKTIETDKRRAERGRQEAVDGLELWERAKTIEQGRLIAGRTQAGSFIVIRRDEGGYWTAYNVLESDETRYSACPSWTIEQVKEAARESYPRRIAYADRWIRHYDFRLIYERAMLGETVGEERAAEMTAKKPRPKQLPILNYRAPDGITILREGWSGDRATETRAQVEMTKAEYAKYRDDHRSMRKVDNSHRIRCVFIRKPGGQHFEGERVCVFLTDSKVHERPELAESPPPKMNPLAVPLCMQEPTDHVAPRASAEPNPYDAMRQQLKSGGVQVSVVHSPGFYPTPPTLAAAVIEAARMEPGMKVLEPSAGAGAMASLAKTAGGIVTAVEINPHLCATLEGLALHRLIPGDFLEQSESLGQFDRIIMNPPFERCADTRHVMRAMSRFLAPEGVLVAIMSAAVEYRGDDLTLALRSGVQARGGEFIRLPAGSFKPSGTDVNTVALVIRGDADAFRNLPTDARAA